MRKLRARLISIGVLIMLLFSPYFLWEVGSSLPYQVEVIDKTVPVDNYREHGGLLWVMQHLKLVTRDQLAYDKSVDYYGYHPQEHKGDTNLQIKGKPDMIYVTDTYGVYQQDLATEGNQQGERSGLVYGGMTKEEWQAIEAAHGDKTLLIAEFNSLATPPDRKFAP